MTYTQSRHTGALYAENHQASDKIEDTEVDGLSIVIN